MTPEERINRILDAADSHLPVLRQCFLNIIDTILEDHFDGNLVDEYLENNDIEKAIEASGILEIDPMTYGSGIPKDEPSLTNQLQTIFSLGAILALQELGDNGKKASFDVLGERAVYFLRFSAARLSLDLLSSSTAGLRLAMEHYLSIAATRGSISDILRNHVGLTSQQSQALINFRNQLENKKNLGFTSAEGRKLSEFDQGLVSRQMKYGNLSKEDIESLVSRYAKNLLDKRAMDIARTESLRYINSGKQEAWSQAVDQGAIDDNSVRKFWYTMGDAKVRPTHRPIPSMNPFGVKVKAYFATPFGPVLGPGDYNTGLINCRCGVILSSVV
jgi:hypothetical protein